MTRFSVGYPYAIKVIDDGLTFAEKMFAEFLADPKEADTFGMALLDLRERIATSVKAIADGEAAKNSTLAEPKSTTRATPSDEFASNSESLAKAGIDAPELSKVCSAIEGVCDDIGIGEWTAGLAEMLDDLYADGLVCQKLSEWGFNAAFYANDNKLRHYLDTLASSILDLHLQNRPAMEQRQQASQEGVELRWRRDMQKVNEAVRDIRACVLELESWIAEAEPAKVAEWKPSTDFRSVLWFGSVYSFTANPKQNGKGWSARCPAHGDPRPVVVELTRDAKAAWKEYYNHHAQEQSDLSGDLSAAWSKLEEHAARLALVVHCARWAADDPDLQSPDAVDAESMKAGITLAQWFKAEARRVYALLSESDDDRDQRRLIEWIERKGGSVTAREVQQGHRQYRTAHAAEAALEALGKAGYGDWEPTPPGRRGQPTRRFVLASTVYGNSLKPRENSNTVDVDSVDTPETQSDDEWGEL